MKLNDFIFEYKSNNKYPGLVRIRTFVNQKKELYVVFTDLYLKNTAASVTNDLEKIYEGLINSGHIDKRYKIIEHYEDENISWWNKHKNNGKFSLVKLTNNGIPIWNECSGEDMIELLETEHKEFLDKTWNHQEHINTIERKRMRMNPLFDYQYTESPEVICRRLEINEKKKKKAELLKLINSNSGERDILRFLNTDLTFFSEVYANPAEEYICFSEFPIGDGGRVDFAVFSSRSRMDVTLIEVKGAEFPLMINSGGYRVFSKKIEIAISQAKARSGYVHRNYMQFREYVHKVRKEVENRTYLGKALLGPEIKLLVDPNKDVAVRYIVIGGRTENDLSESWKRHEYESSNNPPMYIETWDSFARRLSRN